jgi:hypothetical protein
MQEKPNTEESKPSPQNTPQEFFYFRCPHGHENRISADSDGQYERLADDRIVVQCQSCGWRSDPFMPALFQHTVPGDVLLWVYTTREAKALQSGFHLAFGQPSPMFMQPVPTPASPSPAVPEQPPVAAEPSAIAIAPAFEELAMENQSTQTTATTKHPVLQKTNRISRNAMSHILADAPAPKPEQTTISSGALASGDNKATTAKTIADTVEIAVRPTAIGESTSGGDSHSYHYFPQGVPRVQMKLPWLSHWCQNLLWLLALAAISFLCLRSCETQSDKIAQAIRSIEIKTVATPKNTAVPVMADEEKYQALLQQQKELQKELHKQQTAIREWQSNYETLQANYQNEQRARQELEKQQALAKKESERAVSETGSMPKNYTELQQAYQALLKNWQRQFSVEAIYSGERDFLQPCQSQDGSFFMFYEDQQVAHGNKLQKVLKITIPDGNELKSHVLFQTKEIQEKQGEIPFIYSWDSGENAALLTRIEGENCIYHIKFQVRGGKCKVLPPGEVATATYPEVLGPPSISPNGQYVAWIHKNSSEMAVKVYNLKDGNTIGKAVGGGDTSKVPGWSADSKTLFFLTLDGKGILAWKFLTQEKWNKVFSEEVYGRYLAASPDGKWLAFLRRSAEGKGKVDLCLWEVAKGESGEVRTLLAGFLSVETCRPAWGTDGRFVAIIRSGARDEIVMQDVAGESAFTLFDKAGKILWLDWSYAGTILFSYKEGLFTRPYRARLGSWLGK